MRDRRTALITGCAGAIGHATAARLATTGLRIIGTDIALHENDGTADSTFIVDLADPDACGCLLAAVGRVDVLVNNAALFTGTALEEATVDELDRLYAVNLRAPALLARALAPQMAARGWGRIINISSVGAHVGGLSAGSAFYSATKAGLLALTRSLARLYGSSGVTSNAVAPGWIETKMSEAAKAAGLAASEADIPLRRAGAPSEVAEAIAFLASDEASFITGATLDVNGGWVMR